MTSERNQENLKRFHKHLDESQASVQFAKKYLESQGYEVRGKPAKTTPSYEDRMKYVDNGDLEYYKEGEWKRVEVKHTSRAFTNAEDWPFKNMFVCAIHAWDNADPKPDIYIQFDNDMSHVAEIPGSTSTEWFKMSFKDSRYVNYRQTAYCCPLDLIKFSKVEM
jgi:hypothetical protein